MSFLGRKRPAVDGEPAAAAKPRPSAYDKALGWLARRDHSQHELRRKLGQSGYHRDETGEALQRLEQQQYQDDDRFGQMLVRSRAGQGYGPGRIRAELQSHGLNDPAIQQWLDEAEQDWDALAAAQARRRFGGRPTANIKQQRRRAQCLLRRGFSGASVRKALAGVALTELDDGEPPT